MSMSKIYYIDVGNIHPYLVEQYMDLVIDSYKNNKPFPKITEIGKETFWGKIKRIIKTWIWYADFTSL